MEKTLQGIVLHRIEHSDSSAILKVLTAENGLGSYIWKGAKKKRKGGNYGSITLPLNRVEISARHRREGELHLIKEIRISEAFRNIPFDPMRNSIAIFLGEFLYRTAHHQSPDPSYFGTVWECIGILDQAEDPRDLHIHFLAQAMIPHGIAPELEAGSDAYFDILKGEVIRREPEHHLFLSPEQSQTLSEMLRTEIEDHRRFLVGTSERQQLLGKLIEHFRVHLGDFGPINSLEVLKELSKS